MFSNRLASLDEVKKYYEIPFEDYAVAIFHPITTEIQKMEEYAENFVNALLKDKRNYVVIYPNNDLGSESILKQYERLEGNGRFRVFPSIRFEYFLVLLKNSKFIIGNSSAGIREAPYYGIPIINIGSRQSNRSLHSEILNSDYRMEDILAVLKAVDLSKQSVPVESFGKGNSAQLFVKTLENKQLWRINHQKQFRDLENT